MRNQGEQAASKLLQLVMTQSQQQLKSKKLVSKHLGQACGQSVMSVVADTNIHQGLQKQCNYYERRISQPKLMKPHIRDSMAIAQIRQHKGQTERGRVTFRIESKTGSTYDRSPEMSSTQYLPNRKRIRRVYSRGDTFGGGYVSENRQRDLNEKINWLRSAKIEEERQEKAQLQHRQQVESEHKKYLAKVVREMKKNAKTGHTYDVDARILYQSVNLLKKNQNLPLDRRVSYKVQENIANKSPVSEKAKQPSPPKAKAEFIATVPSPSPRKRPWAQHISNLQQQANPSDSIVIDCNDHFNNNHLRQTSNIGFIQAAPGTHYMQNNPENQKAMDMCSQLQNSSKGHSYRSNVWADNRHKQFASFLEKSRDSYSAMQNEDEKNQDHFRGRVSQTSNLSHRLEHNHSKRSKEGNIQQNENLFNKELL